MAFSVATVMDFCYIPMKFKTRRSDLKTIFTTTEIEPAKHTHTHTHTHTIDGSLEKQACAQTHRFMRFRRPTLSGS